MQVNTSVYPAGYKPKVVYGHLEISYYPEKYREIAKTNPEKVRPHVDRVNVGPILFTLDDRDDIPTMKMHDDIIKRAWPLSETKFAENFKWVSQIIVEKDLGRVSYQFNQNIH
jgi:hypothetical protein